MRSQSLSMRLAGTLVSALAVMGCVLVEFGGEDEPKALNGKPLNVKVEPLLGAARLSWDPPPSSQDPRVEPLYIADYFAWSAEDTSKRCQSYGRFSCVITGLANEVPHTFYVKAVDSEGRIWRSARTGSVTPTAKFGVYWRKLETGIVDNANGVPWNGTTRDALWVSQLGLWVVVGSTFYGPMALTSPDGDQWTQRIPSNFQDEDLNAVVWNGSLLVAVGSDGFGDTMILTSPDAVTWTERTSSNLHTPLRDVAWGNGQFVAVGDWGTVLTSPNGIAWTRRTPGNGPDLYAVAWTGARFVAYGKQNNGFSDQLITSPDGIAWSAPAQREWYSLDDVEPPRYRRLVWTGTKLYAFGKTSQIGISVDGLTWTDTTVTYADQGAMFFRGLSDAQWTGKGFLGISGHGTHVMRSSDGLNWTHQAIDLIGRNVKLTALALRDTTQALLVGDDGELRLTP